MTYQVGTASHESAIPRINLAIGPFCPVRCEGCYNRFNSSGLVSGEEVILFARAIADIGIRRSIVSGGDPLAHPDILDILGGLPESMDHIRLDTVGTSFLPDVDSVPVVYKGRGVMPTYDPAQLIGRVSLINIPRDGLTERTAQRFRHGRRGQTLAEGNVVAGRITDAGIPLGINTVVNGYNIEEVPAMLDVVRDLGACQWRLFQFDPEGPNQSSHVDELVVADADFVRVTEGIRSAGGDDLAVFAGGVNNRGTYHMVDSAGQLYERTPGIGEQVIGHITSERDLVMASLRARIENFYSSPN
jgi:pyruvate-formate lyase-activating enzyme